MNYSHSTLHSTKFYSKAGCMILLFLLLGMLLSLSSCNNKNGQIPVYTGMTINNKAAKQAAFPSYDLLALDAYNPWESLVVANPCNSNGVSEHPNPEHGNNSENGHVHGDLFGKEADQEDPFDQVEGTGQSNEDILQGKVESSLEIVGGAKPIYYAEKGQDIYITVHIDNPDNYEILSFTLNGNKYSSYMFEDGSDMENLILKVNVGDVEGVQEYTIDAIKYVDGTDIKDVRMDGNKTVRAGIATDKQPLPAISAEVINFNDVSFDVDIDDQLSLISHSEGEVMAVLYDGDKVVDMKKLTLGEQTSVKFEGLTTNSLYQYAIVAYYDSLDSNGADIHVLYTKAFYTRAILLFNNVVLGTETVDYELSWADDAPDKALQTLVLESAFDGKVSLSVDTLHIDKLRSEADYTLTATYLNGGKEETVSISFRTNAKIAPVLSMNEVSKGQHEVSFSMDFVDPDGIAKLERLQLISDKTGTKDIPMDTRSLSDLLSDTSYTIKATYSYDLNDGTGLHVEEQELVIRTNQKTMPTVTLTESSHSQSSFSFELTLGDPDGIAKLERLQLISDKTGTKDIPMDTRSLSDLLSDTSYTIKITYTYDLMDGNGLQESYETLSCKTDAKETPSFSVDNTRVIVDSTSITADYLLKDVDNILIDYKVELFKGDILIAENEQKNIAFNALSYYTDYTVKISYSYDLNNGNGVQLAVMDYDFKTWPVIDAIECNVVNTSAIFEGNTIYLQIQLDNPLEMVVSKVKINGKTYGVTGASTDAKVFVEIIYNGQFAGGDTVLEVETITAMLDGVSYTIQLNQKVTDKVFLNGKIEIVSLELVNKEFIPFKNGDWVFYSEEVYALVTLRNPTGYVVDSLSDYTKLDDNRYYRAIGGTGAITIDPISALSYHNEYLSKTQYFSKIECSNQVYRVASDDVVYISTPQDLLHMGGGYYYELTNDIDLSGMEWHGAEFFGVFDGKGHSIKNMSVVNSIINADENLYLGLFSRGEGIIKNLNSESITVIAEISSPIGFSGYYGALVGYAEGYLFIDNCSVDNYSTINITYNTALDDAWERAIYVGGLIGAICSESDITVSNCINSSNIYTEGDVRVYAGGFIGYINYSSNVIVNNGINNGNIEACEGKRDTCAGGIVGYIYYSSLSIKNSENRGNVIAGTKVGKLLGHAGDCSDFNVANSH